LTSIPIEEVCVTAAVLKLSLLQLLHERWGHQDVCYVRDKIERDFGIKVKLPREICEPCQFGKAHRLPFGTRLKTHKAGELISADICGPLDVSFGGRKYLLVFTDHFTRYRYCYLLKEKSAAVDALRDMLTNAKSLGHVIQELISDNAREFVSNRFLEILSDFGVKSRLAAPYTPEQNGVEERTFRTIMEMVCMMQYSNPDIVFPNSIWAELAVTAGYILNHTGKSSVE